MGDAQGDAAEIGHAPVIIDPSVSVECGDLTALIADGAIRRISFRGVEAVRGIDCPIRDPDWGTVVPENVSETLETTESGARYRRTFTVFDGALSAEMDVAFSGDGLKASITLTGNRTVSTNRAGFTLLHPLTGVVGEPLTIIHSDKHHEETVFPRQISPGQPAFDISGLIHEVNGVRTDIRFSGEIFEMEDQRNWTDASYKTYCRPIGWPLPYPIEAGETVTQTITLGFSGTPKTTVEVEGTHSHSGTLPDVALAVEPAWTDHVARETLSLLPDVSRLIRFDTADGGLERLSAMSGATELEIIVDDDGDVASALKSIASDMSKSVIAPETVTALPRAYLMSYQPTAEWPSGHGVADAARWAKAAFPDAAIGVGMLTNFTEFNRHPPPDDAGDFTTYSTTAVVHAGDDRSVLETLETLSHVHASARALSAGRPMRLGLATIGMRSNPYGAAVADNPDLARIAMAMDDPRQRTVFAAAFAVAAYAAAADAGCARIALGAAGGPFALGEMDGDRFAAWPIFHVVDALSDLAAGRRSRTPALPDGVHGLFAKVDGGLSGVIANCSFEPVSLALSGQKGVIMTGNSDVSDPAWRRTTADVPFDDLTLEPASVAFVSDRVTS